MDNRLPKNVTGFVSTRGLLLSNAYQPHNSLPITENEDRFAVSTKNNVGLGPKLIDTVRHKLSYGSKLLPLGRDGKIFRRSFKTRDGENLLHASRCNIYTSAGAQSQASSSFQQKKLHFAVRNSSKRILQH